MYSKTDIFMAAAVLFSEQGYHRTTMRELASILDLREGSLYNHIKSKEEILWEIVSRSAHLFLLQARAVPQTVSVEEQLRLLVRGHLEVIAREPHYVAVFFREWTALPHELGLHIKACRDSYEDHFLAVIEEGERQGAFRIASTRLACLFVLSALNWPYQWLNAHGPLKVEQLADLYATFVLAALKGS